MGVRYCVHLHELGGETVTKLRYLACKFDLDQGELKSSRVNPNPSQTETQVENLRLFASPFGQALAKKGGTQLIPGQILLLLVLFRAH